MARDIRFVEPFVRLCQFVHPGDASVARRFIWPLKPREYDRFVVLGLYGFTKIRQRPVRDVVTPTLHRPCSA